MRFTKALSRANSTLRYWNYRRSRPVPLSLRWALAEWLRRLRFELKQK